MTSKENYCADCERQIANGQTVCGYCGGLAKLPSAPSPAGETASDKRPDLVHKFIEGDKGRCAHWFHWLGGNQLCAMKENHPYHAVPEPVPTKETREDCQLFAALRSNREMKAQLADYEKLVLEKVIELGIAPSPEHENEWRNVRAEAAEAKLRDVSEAMKEKPAFDGPMDTPRTVSTHAWDIGMIIDGEIDALLAEHGMSRKDGVSKMTETVARMVQLAINRSAAQFDPLFARIRAIVEGK